VLTSKHIKDMTDVDLKSEKAEDLAAKFYVQWCWETYLTLCQTSAIRRGSCASIAASLMSPALNSRLTWPAGKVISLPRATSTAGCVQKGLASCGMVTPASLIISAQDTTC